MINQLYATLVALLLSLGCFLFPLSAEGLPSRPESRPTPENRITQKLKEAIQREVPTGIATELSNLYLDGRAAGEEEIHLFTNGVPLGLVRFELRNRAAKISGNVTVRGFGRIAVAIAPILHNDTIDSSKIRFERQELTQLLNRGYYLEGTSFAGMRAQGYIRPGAILTSSNTHLPNAVERLQVVELTHQKNGIVVLASMKALEAGKVNDWIRLQNPQTNRIVQARVTGNGTATTR
jgi:flagella basal body P-ring formation protein FlgA